MVAPGMPNTSSSSASSTMSSASASTPFDPQQNKVLVLCFDGTTNAFDSTNTNVAKLFQLLDKTDPKKQACFYQPGVGTYTLPSIVTPITSTLTKIIDMGIGWFFASHVTSGYKFIVDNWMPGDKICLFGFSRGAYTARALAGMVEKVGVIPANNDQQLQFAWSMYKEVDKSGEHTKADLARTFKETFSRDVQIDFVGVWDTVGSVGGIIERHYPYTANNRSIKIFRHAISLDERRVKFAQNRYHYKTTSSKGGAADPEGASNPLTTVGASGSLHVLRDTYKADVEEVYFAGCHTDVGGGNQLNETQRQLSNIPLDWMVAQILKTGVGIRFNEPALTAFQQRYNAAFTSVDSAAPASSRTNGSTNGIVIGSLDGRVNANIIPSIDDSLVIKALKDLVVVPFWWMLECFPFKRKYQDHADSEKKWRVSYWPHFGRARTVAPGSKIHDSVRDKMNLAGLHYKPAPQLPSDVEWVST